MNVQYNSDFKRKLCIDICLNSKYNNVFLKTLEKCITVFIKDNHCFEPIVEKISDFKILNSSSNIDYDDLSFDELNKMFTKKY